MHFQSSAELLRITQLQCPYPQLEVGGHTLPRIEVFQLTLLDEAIALVHALGADGLDLEGDRSLNVCHGHDDLLVIAVEHLPESRVVSSSIMKGAGLAFGMRVLACSFE